MKKIIDIKAREILDSRGNPTVECDLYFEIIFLEGLLSHLVLQQALHEAIRIKR